MSVAGLLRRHRAASATDAGSLSCAPFPCQSLKHFTTPKHCHFQLRVFYRVGKEMCTAPWRMDLPGRTCPNGSVLRVWGTWCCPFSLCSGCGLFCRSRLYTHTGILSQPCYGFNNNYLTCKFKICRRFERSTCLDTCISYFGMRKSNMHLCFFFLFSCITYFFFLPCFAESFLTEVNTVLGRSWQQGPELLF